MTKIYTHSPDSSFDGATLEITSDYSLPDNPSYGKEKVVLSFKEGKVIATFQSGLKKSFSSIEEAVSYFFNMLF